MQTAEPGPHRSTTPNAVAYIKADPPLSILFEREIWPLKGEIYRAAKRMVYSHADAEDLVQDTLIRALVGYGRFDHGHPRAWLLAILRNTAISAYRARLRRPLEVLTDEVPALASTRSPESAVVDGLPSASTVAALSHLSDACREIVYFADVEGLRYAEIATLLGIPLGTVMSRLHRSRARLRELLIDEVA